MSMSQSRQHRKEVGRGGGAGNKGDLHTFAYQLELDLQGMFLQCCFDFFFRAEFFSSSTVMPFLKREDLKICRPSIQSSSLQN